MDLLGPHPEREAVDALDPAALAAAQRDAGGDAGGEGQAELRGVPWKARVASGIALRGGQRCRVERVDGLTLWVRAE